MFEWMDCFRSTPFRVDEEYMEESEIVTVNTWNVLRQRFSSVLNCSLISMLWKYTVQVISAFHAILLFWARLALLSCIWAATELNTSLGCQTLCFKVRWSSIKTWHLTCVQNLQSKPSLSSKANRYKGLLHLLSWKSADIFKASLNCFAQWTEWSNAFGLVND